MFAAIAVLLAAQLSSLFVFPQPNSLRWYGDETWLMTEAYQQFTTGSVSYPLAVGSQIEHGKGMMLSLTWLSAVLYGIPAAIAYPNVVVAGRVVTAVLAIGLLAFLYLASRRFGASRLTASLAVLLLITGRSFLFASHSARTDLLVGLIVLASVATFARWARERFRPRPAQWFLISAMLTFLAFSSSIHLLTLLGLVSLYFCWLLGAFANTHNIVSAIGGTIAILALLIVGYYVAGGPHQLLPASAGPNQFRDVITSIPILRPFSRSVQVANLVIRFKQLCAESPQLFLLALAIPLAVRRSDWKRPLIVACAIVCLSWLLLEGAEINYMMHLLPLLFFVLALGLARMIQRWQPSLIVVVLAAIVCFSFAARDAVVAHAVGSGLDRANEQAVTSIQHWAIMSSSNNARPLVLTEPPTLDKLSQTAELRVMTDHFVSFPTRHEPLDSLLSRLHVDYAVLYDSRAFPKDRARSDSLYRTIRRVGTLLTTEVGTYGDIGRSYFAPTAWPDTILLFKLVK